MLRFISLAFFISLRFALNDGAMPEELKSHILSVHNELRNAQPGRETNKLNYAQKLEDKAKEFVESCKYITDELAVNLGYSTKQTPEKELIDEILTTWKDEKKDYDASKKCCQGGKSRRFMQMVWGATKTMGCFGTRCPKMKRIFENDTIANAYLFGCYYDPMGYIGNQFVTKSKKEGELRCKLGQKNDAKYTNLCIGEPLCEDVQRDCEGWEDECSSVALETYMKKYCSKTCGFCKVHETKRSQSKGGAARLVGHSLASMLFVLAGIAASMISVV